MANVLVTGGCGFIGAWILRKLFDGGHRATVWDLEKVTRRWEMTLTPQEIAQVGFESVRIDEPEQVKAAMLKLAPDAVIHLAGLQVPTCKANPLMGARVNVLGTLGVFEAALALPKRPGLAFASSAAVFGSDADYDHQTVGDASQPLPGTHYGGFKLCNELNAKVYWNDQKFPSVGLRPMTVYGPGRDVGMTSFPTRAIAAAVLGQKFDVPFRGPTVYTFASEVADYFVAGALDPKPGAPAYTVGGEIIDVPGFLATAAEELPAVKDLVTCSGGDLPITWKLDDAELRKAYPQVKRVSLRDGVRKTVEIFKRMAKEGKLSV